jgi:hypothetical protein
MGRIELHHHHHHALKNSKPFMDPKSSTHFGGLGVSNHGQNKEV